MPTVAIISKPQKPELGNILHDLTIWMRARGFSPMLDPVSGSYIGAMDVTPRHEMPARDPKLVVVLGGDGTLLAAARVFATTGVPILSVNLGSLGFLTEVPLSDLYSTLEGWCNHCCETDERSMLQVTLKRASNGIECYEALNDVVAAKGAIARMAHFTVKVDDETVATFRADGVIVSTPTGSTAYNLAANGPILAPNIDGIIVTPICPHVLTLRPLVVRDDANISVSIEGIPDQTYLTVDGQEMVQLRIGDTIHCRRSSHTVRLLRMGANGFYDVLRSKLKYGER